MAGTRSSARLAQKQASSPASSPPSAAGTKRKPDHGSSPTAKRGKKAVEKDQKTLEETFPDESKGKDSEVTDQDGAKPTVQHEPAHSAEEAKAEDKSAEDVEMKDAPETTADDNSKRDEVVAPSQQESQVQPTADRQEPQAQSTAVQQESQVQDSKVNQEHHGQDSKVNQEHHGQETTAQQDSRAQDTTVQQESQAQDSKANQENHGQQTTARQDSHGQDTNGQQQLQEHDVSSGSQIQESTIPQPSGAANGDTAIDAKAREKETPSSILEKGIIYFFFRGRVGIDHPEGVSDVARSYIIVRPIPHGAKLGDGPIGDANNSRLFALPKKVLPLSGKDRFMMFVEKAKVSFQTLKDEFLSASDYETKTAGVRHTPAPTPIGEGIYAITTTGRESHLAYILTIPSELGEVQKEIGLKERGSFILSTRNPDYEAPNYAQLPKGPEFPQSIKDEFRSLRWTGTRPHHLDVDNCQFLLIGESSGLDNATATQKQDDNPEKAEPKEELEKLEHEDELRVEGLKGDESAAIFADLDIHAKDYPKVQTTF